MSAPNTGDTPICRRITDLSRQLADALAEWHEAMGIPHTFVAYVPSTQASEAYYLCDQPWQMTAEDRLTYHAKEFAKAAHELDPEAEELWIGRAESALKGGPRYSAIVSAKQEKRS